MVDWTHEVVVSFSSETLEIDHFVRTPSIYYQALSNLAYVHHGRLR